MNDYLVPCVNPAYFSKHGFTQEGDFYVKEEFQRADFIFNGQLVPHAISRKVRFRVYDVDPYLGTNIEFYINNRLQVSGYWTTRTDFEQSFQL